MNIRKIIHILIVIIVVATTLTILWLLSLPIMGRLGIPSIQPWWLTTGVYNIICSILVIISLIGNTVFLCVWVVWKVLKTLDFFPVDLVIDPILSLSIFTEPDNAGLFRLYSNIFNIGGSLENRFKQVGKTVYEFLKDNKKIYAEMAKPLADSVNKYDSPQQSSDNTNSSKTPDQQSLLSDTEKRTVDDLYQQCLEEQMQDIKMNISASDKISIQAANASAKVLCKAKSVFHVQNFLSSKIS